MCRTATNRECSSNACRLLAFRFGRATALQSTSDSVDQLQAQIEQLHSRLKQAEFNFRASQEENAQIRQEMAERTVEAARLRWELARRDRAELFKEVPSPSAMKH